MNRVLITGGAGYIGSATVRVFLERKWEVHILDHLALGHPASLPPTATFHPIDLQERAQTLAVLAEIQPDAVIHFAASSLVGPSVSDPLSTWRNNLLGGMNLLEAMTQAGTRRLIFSSTAAVYGEPQILPIPENHPIQPTNPYGQSKAALESLIRDWSNAGFGNYGILRYFNAAGAWNPDLGEDHRPETHLIPLVLQVALGQRQAISVFGTDYDTPDGSAIRDYIHIRDLAEAHALTLEYLQRTATNQTLNLGTGQGHSVLEVIREAEQVSGRRISIDYAPRRPGDPSRLVADPTLAQVILGWRPLHSELKTILGDAWAWHQKNPGGFSQTTPLAT
jgi:UDP-glucose 4-epimerase